MVKNDRVLVGVSEIADFLRVSSKKLQSWRKSYPDIPIWTDGVGGQLYADKEAIAEWQCSLFRRCQAHSSANMEKY